MATDEELMQSVAQGDPSALRELCLRWERPLYRFLHRVADGRDTDDLFQETWLRVVRSARRFDATRRFSTWLFQIALNLARDLRRRPAAQATDPEALDRLPALGAAGEVSSHAAVDAALDARRLLAALPEAQRDVVVLRVLQDVGEQETAAILACPRGTVKSRLHHALARLAVLARPDASS